MRSLSRKLGRSLISVAVVVVAVGPAHAGGAPREASLDGASEVPGPGDPDGTGFASIELNQGQGTLCYELAVADIAPATAAHVHRAPAGVPGPVVVPLNPPATGSSSGCVLVDRALIKEIRQHPDAYYVNVHNAQFPAGAVRGQLNKPGLGN